MKYLFTILLLLEVLAQFKSYAHGLQQHINAATNVFNGYGIEGRTSSSQDEVSFY